MAAETLYRRLLGAALDEAPERLRRFHTGPMGGKGFGLFVVERGRSIPQRTLARLMRLPSPGRDVPVHLDVRPDGDREIWLRRFGTRLLRTVQWSRGELLAERSGPITLFMRLSADRHGIGFHYHASRFLGIPIPRPLAMHVNARANGTPRGWLVEVIISSPIFGTITTYRGEIAFNE